MKLIRAVLKLPKIVGVIILLCFFGSFLNSCITFKPPQNHPPQRTQCHRYSVHVTHLHASQVVPITQTSKTMKIEYQYVLMSNRMKAVAIYERNVWIGMDKGVSSLNCLIGNQTG